MVAVCAIAWPNEVSRFSLLFSLALNAVTQDDGSKAESCFRRAPLYVSVEEPDERSEVIVVCGSCEKSEVSSSFLAGWVRLSVQTREGR